MPRPLQQRRNPLLRRARALGSAAALSADPKMMEAYLSGDPYLCQTGGRSTGRCGQSDTRPIRAETRAKLVASIDCGRRWLDEIAAGIITDVG